MIWNIKDTLPTWMYVYITKSLFFLVTNFAAVTVCITWPHIQYQNCNRRLSTAAYNYDYTKQTQFLVFKGNQMTEFSAGKYIFGLDQMFMHMYCKSPITFDSHCVKLPSTNFHPLPKPQRLCKPHIPRLHPSRAWVYKARAMHDTVVILCYRPIAWLRIGSCIF